MQARKIYLYIKISPDGLFYLGKFIERKPGSYLNVYTYKGSGIYWRRHLKAHQFKAKDLQTIVLHETYDVKEIETLGLYYSKLFDIVASEQWANLIEENGEGCCNILDDEMIKRRALKIRGTKHAEYQCPHCLLIGRGINMKRYHFDNCPSLTGKQVDEIVQCPHCRLTGPKPNMIKWHFDNCRSLQSFVIDHDKVLSDPKWNYPSKGVWKLTDMTKNRMSKARSKAIIQTDLMGNMMQEWESAKLASITLKIGRSNITACCRGKRDLAGPFKWRYK